MTRIVRLTERDLSRLVRRVINEQAWGEFDDITPAFQVFCNSLNSKIPQPSQKPNTTSATQPKLSVKRVVNRQVAPGQPQGDGFMWQFYLGGKPIAGYTHNVEELFENSNLDYAVIGNRILSKESN